MSVIIKSLQKITARTNSSFFLFTGFYAFAKSFEADIFGGTDDIFKNYITVFCNGILRDGTVDLDDGNVKILQITEGGITASEVVKQD